MKNSLRFLALAALVTLPIVGRAQLYSNLSPISPSNISPNFSAIQTFTGFSNLSNITWTVTNTDSSAGTASFSTYIAQWSTGTDTAIPGTFQTIEGGISTGSIGAGLSTNLSFTASMPPLDSSLTYALVLSYDGPGSTLFAATTGTNPGDQFFSSGGAGAAGFTVPGLGGVAGFQSLLESDGTGGIFLPGTAVNYGSAYVMSISGTPVPEPKTAAAGIAALFVAALVGRRMMLRRKLATVPLAA